MSLVHTFPRLTIDGEGSWEGVVLYTCIDMPLRMPYMACYNKLSIESLGAVCSMCPHRQKYKI